MMKKPAAYILTCTLPLIASLPAGAVSVQARSVPPMKTTPVAVQEEPAIPLPEFIYEDPGIKIECEQMRLVRCEAQEDVSASGGNSVCIKEKDAVLECAVTLQAGTYEMLVMERSFYNDQARLLVTVDGVESKVAPSNPPLGMWELTIRTPVYLTVTEEHAVAVSIKNHAGAKSGKHTSLDYIQFVQIQEDSPAPDGGMDGDGLQDLDRPEDRQPPDSENLFS